MTTRNPEYRKWIREECKCVVCVKLLLPSGLREWFYRIIDPAHTENNGMRSKGNDSSCAPLCRRHHQHYDAGREAFEAKYEVDMKAEAQKFYAAFLIEREAKKVNKEKDNLPAAGVSRRPCEESMRLATLLVDWMSDQKYGEESILHAVVCCDFVSRNRFIRAVAFQIESLQGTLASVPPQAETDVCGAPQGEGE